MAVLGNRNRLVMAATTAALLVLLPPAERRVASAALVVSRRLGPSCRRSRRASPFAAKIRPRTTAAATTTMSIDSRRLRFYSCDSSLSSSMMSSSSASVSAGATLEPLSALCSGKPGGGVIDMVRSQTAETFASSSSSLNDEDGPDRFASDASSSSSSSGTTPPSRRSGPGIDLSPEERELFDLLSQVRDETEGLSSTLRVAGGWVRDKLLAHPEFARFPSRLRHDVDGVGGGDPKSSPGHVERLTSKFQPSMGRQGTKVIGDHGTVGGGHRIALDTEQPVDIDIALDDVLGREFADRVNEYFAGHGREKVSVGVVLKNPEKSKHLETATVKVGSFWIDLVNLRAEEYTEDSRIPDLMRIGTPEEDAHRRDLTINALFYNIDSGRVEDYTGRGLDDLRRGVVATPLPPLTTLLDDPLRVLRSVRFAARLRFTMDDALRDAACDPRVREALALKVSRERVGGEVDLMLRSPDPVGAMRLLINLKLADTVFPLTEAVSCDDARDGVFSKGLTLLSSAHDHLVDCKIDPPLWCGGGTRSRDVSSLWSGMEERTLTEDEEARRLLWYAAFLKPLMDHAEAASAASSSSSLTEGEDVDGLGGAGKGGAGGGGRRRRGKKSNRSAVCRLMLDELKRPTRDAEAVRKIMRAADEFTALLEGGCDLSAVAVLLSEIRVRHHPIDDDDRINGEIDEDGIVGEGNEGARRNGGGGYVTCSMNSAVVDSETEDDPLWRGAMEFRLLCSKVLKRVGPLWRAALVLSLSERLASMNRDEFDYAIEGDVIDETRAESRRGVVERYDAFASSLLQLGLVGVWTEKPMIDGWIVKNEVLRNIPEGPIFREIMNEQSNWMTTHPGGNEEALREHLRDAFREFV